MATTVYTPLGMLGYGFPMASLEEAKKHGFDVIALDAGSVDPGPYYLGSGKSFTSRAMVKRDLKLIVQAGWEAKAPVLVGTACGSGAKPHLDWAMEILGEIVDELEIHPKVARIDAELDKEQIVKAYRAGKVSCFETTTPLEEQDILDCEHIVAQMGIQPYVEALKGGADIIMGGRAYDAAVIAAFPIMRGENPGLCYHMGKIMECGTAVALPRESDGLIGIVDQDSFTVFPADKKKRCMPDTVAAHTLYERSTPYFHEFPGGGLDLSQCSFTAVDDRSVKVEGSRFIPPKKNLLKIEGAKKCGCRTICPAGIRDPFVIREFDKIEKKVRAKLEADLTEFSPGQDYKLLFHLYGTGEIMKSQDPGIENMEEVGLVMEVLGKTQEISDTVCALCRSAILHMGFEGRKANSGNLAFLYTPAEFPAPPCYEFALYHLMETEDLTSMFPITWIQK